MQILFDSTTRRKPSRPARVFAQGVTTPKRQPYSEADLAWAQEALNASAPDYVVLGPSDATLERQAGEAAFRSACDAWEPRKDGGVRLDPTEEAVRYGCPARTAEQQAEIDRDWEEYDAWSARMSRWVSRNEPGPQPY